MIIKRLIVASVFGMVLIPLLLLSAAWLPAEPHSAREIAGASQSAAVTAAQVPKAGGPKLAEVANIEIGPSLPAQLGALAAGTFLLLPFALSMWATLRRQG